MKKKVIAVALVTLASLSASQAFAGGDGQVNFTGSITDQACTVTNTVSNPLDVDLKTYSTSEFAQTGHETAKVAFDIALTNCPATVTKAAVNFDGIADATNGELLALTKETGAASGVGIRLYDKSGVLSLNKTSQSYDLASGDNKLNFFAAYQSTAAAVTPGPANGVANFSIVYN